MPKTLKEKAVKLKSRPIRLAKKTSSHSVGLRHRPKFANISPIPVTLKENVFEPLPQQALATPPAQSPKLKTMAIWASQRVYLLLGLFVLLTSLTLTARALITVSDSGVSGNASVSLDSLGTLNIGTASSTGINIGKPGMPVTVQGPLTLGTASTTAGQLLFNNSSNSFTTLLRASSSQTSNLSFTLPGTLGNSGQAMLTDGSGGLYFGSGSSTGSSADFASATDLNFYNIAAWGDSLTNNMTTYLGAVMSKYAIYNGGISGETSTQIMNRMLPATDKYNYTDVIWAGRNNFSSPATVKANIASMVVVLPSPKHFLVLSVINGSNSGESIGGADYNTIIQLNNDLAALYPNNYFDIRSYLVSQYNPAIPQDVIDHTNDIVPSSLRVDFIHLTPAGYTLVANKISDFITQNYSQATSKAVSYTDLPNIFFAPPQMGTLNIVSGGMLKYNNLPFAMAQTTLGNNYFGNAGNLTATGTNNTGLGRGALSLISSGTDNSAVGFGALNINTTGSNNTAVGSGALIFSTTGSQNTASGHFALRFNTTGSYNTAMGDSALYTNISGQRNTAVGVASLIANTTGGFNVANGMNTLSANTTGTFNTAVGYAALGANSTGTNNTALGEAALTANTTGTDNSAVGYSALVFNTTGINNVANGSFAMRFNTTGNNNTVMGNTALYANTTGQRNTAIGNSALIGNTTGGFNAALGMNAGATLISGSNNFFLGYGADVDPSASTTLTNSGAIGFNAKVATSNSIILGGTGANAVNVGIGTSTPTSKLQVVGLPIFANNAAAIVGGLTAGAFYRTGADPDPVMVVH